MGITYAQPVSAPGTATGGREARLPSLAPGAAPAVLAGVTETCAVCGAVLEAPAPEGRGLLPGWFVALGIEVATRRTRYGSLAWHALKGDVEICSGVTGDTPDAVVDMVACVALALDLCKACGTACAGGRTALLD